MQFHPDVVVAVVHRPGEGRGITPTDLLQGCLESPGVFHDVSFQVRAGEIVGLAGLVGAGRSEIARAVFGVDKYAAGRVTMGGRAVRRGDPRDAVRAGIAFIPEDRRQQG
ncbi:MAG: ATP-binding cassette domain-containing protein, partial [Gordonia polyisoprenivorans]|nr:ATP-binding cassette domain-containing protein [Gordonia polyisoprenivorans]